MSASESNRIEEMARAMGSVPAEEDRPRPSGRLIRPADGILLDDKHFRLEDVGELTRRLIAHSEGRLEELRRASAAAEQRVRSLVTQSRAKIDRAIEMTRSLIEERLRAATTESARLREEGKRTGIEQGRAEGHADGHRAGFESGYAEGLERGLLEGRRSAEMEVRARAEEILARGAGDAAKTVVSLSKELERNWREVIGGAHRDLLKLALGVAEKIVRREVRRSPEIVTETLAIAIDRIADRSRLTIELHPADLAVVGEYLRDLRERLGESSAIRVVERPEIQRGGCVVRTPNSVVDLTVETQIEILERTLVASGVGEAVA